MENRNNDFFQMNHKSNYYLINNYDNQQEVNNTFNSDFVNMEDSIDYEKDDYFNNLQNNRKYSFIQKKEIHLNRKVVQSSNKNTLS